MNNKEFIQKLAEVNDFNARESQRIVNQTIECIASLMEDGNDVMIHGFGTFEVKYRKERIINNPQTQKKMLVPPKLSLCFHLSPSAKNKLK